MDTEVFRPECEVIHFSRHFPKDKEIHVQEAWPIVESAFRNYDIFLKLNLEDASMKIWAAKWKVHEDIFIKARVVLHLLSEGDSAHVAIFFLDQKPYDIIKIGSQVGGLCYKFGYEDQFLELKELLLGPRGSYLEKLSAMTGCFFVVDDDIVFAAGEFTKLVIARMIVEGCFARKVSVISLIDRVTEEGVYGAGLLEGVSGVSMLKAWPELDAVLKRKPSSP